MQNWSINGRYGIKTQLCAALSRVFQDYYILFRRMMYPSMMVGNVWEGIHGHRHERRRKNEIVSIFSIAGCHK